MPRYAHERFTDVPSTSLFAAIVDVARWPEWDTGLERVVPQAGPMVVGARFHLKPKGGPRTRMLVLACDEPRVFADAALLPLARMTTTHAFETTADGGTRVRVTIEVRGPLAVLWDRLVARKQALGLEAQTAAFLAFARTRAARGLSAELP